MRDLLLSVTLVAVFSVKKNRGWGVVINPALRGGVFQRTSPRSSQRHLRFPVSTAGQHPRSLRRLARAIRTRFQNLYSIEIGVVGMTTAGAAEMLPATRIGVNGATSGARLRRIGRRHFDQLAARPRQLVAQHVRKARPSRPGDVPREVAILDHAGNIQILNHDGAVALGVVVAENVQCVFALSPDLAVQTHHAELRLFSVLRSFLSSRDGTVGAGEPGQCLFEVGGVGNKSPVAVGEQVGHTAIDGDDGLGARGRVGDLDLADNRGKPLISVSVDRAGCGLTLKRSVSDAAQVAELQEANAIARKTPRSHTRRCERKRSWSPSLPVWSPTDPLEAPLPRIFEFSQKLNAHPAWNVSKPRQLCAKVGEFAHLSKRRWIDPLPLLASEPHQPLLVSEVPQEPESILPLTKPRDLRWRRVDAKPKALVNEHQTGSDLLCPPITGHVPGSCDSDAGHTFFVAQNRGKAIGAPDFMRAKLEVAV